MPIASVVIYSHFAVFFMAVIIIVIYIHHSSFSLAVLVYRTRQSQFTLLCVGEPVDVVYNFPERMRGRRHLCPGTARKST